MTAPLQLKTNKQLGASSWKLDANFLIISECMVRTERAFLEATHTGKLTMTFQEVVVERRVAYYITPELGLDLM